MSQWMKLESVRHQVALAGRISNAQTGQAIAGAQISIAETVVAVSAVDGHFHLMDLPNGRYTLVATLPKAGSRYGIGTVTVTVSHDEVGTIAMAEANIELSPTTLMGQITVKSAEGQKPVSMVQIFIQGSGESTYTDKQGKYLLAGLEVGDRKVSISAKGYRPVPPQSVRFETAGEVQSLNISLVPIVKE